MEAKIGRITITTNHPASHYGAGIALIDGDGAAHGPDDFVKSTLPVGPEYFRVADLIASGVAGNPVNWREYTDEEIGFINRFLSQSPEPVVLDFQALQEGWAENKQEANAAETI